ncbi:MAG: GNAT family N-acetyltransferase [Aerococcus sp.]|nr:GNAT family N-acetyltransferase [Aerococcus sp.]
MVHVTERTTALKTELVSIWEASVRATHHFLTPTAIEDMKHYVIQALGSVPHLPIVENDQGQLAGFIGIDGQELSMLFIAPAFMGQRIGRALLTEGTTHYGVDRLTVNEQNSQALGLYEHLGFHVYKRTDHDEQGKP